jgi:predicted alpha/beta superfamily hydrolase
VAQYLAMLKFRPQIFLLLSWIIPLHVPLSGQQNPDVTSRNDKPFILGRIVELYSDILKENRTLNIYLPEGYDEHDAKRYPVIYLLDGAADEDFLHVVGLVHFNTFPWIDRIPKSIVVGIANTDRKRDFTFPTTIDSDKEKYPTTGGSAAFIDFMKQELQPFIDKTYKTTSDKTLIGQSLGGLLATEVLLNHQRLFDKYIIISPSLWWNNGSLLRQQLVRDDLPDAPLHVYIGVGKEGLTPGAFPRVMEVDANMLADQLKALHHTSLHVYFDYLPDEDHATVGHQAVFNAFRMLYPSTGAE